MATLLCSPHVEHRDARCTPYIDYVGSRLPIVLVTSTSKLLHIYTLPLNDTMLAALYLKAFLMRLTFMISPQGPLIPRGNEMVSELSFRRLGSPCL